MRAEAGGVGVGGLRRMGPFGARARRHARRNGIGAIRARRHAATPSARPKGAMFFSRPLRRRPLHFFLHQPAHVVVECAEALWADVAYLDASRTRLVPGPPAKHEHDLVAAMPRAGVMFCTFGPESAAFDVEIVHSAVHNVVGQFETLCYH